MISSSSLIFCADYRRQVAFGSPEIAAMIVKERGFLSSVVHMLQSVVNRESVPLESAAFALLMMYNCALVGGNLVAVPIAAEEGLVSTLLSFAASGEKHEPFVYFFRR
jgi:hypothetical protein